MRSFTPRVSALDLRVGLRMLAKYPGLTAVGTTAIALAITLGAVYFEAVDKYRNPRLPGPDGDRIVSIRNWDVNASEVESRVLYDLATWRQQVRTVTNLGASVDFQRNLITDDGLVEPVHGAEMSASGFRLLGTPALLGRPLVDRDENPAEPPVVVLSHSLWQSRFGGDPGVVGRSVKLGTAAATIVGVMPEGFAFPVNHRIWAPLRVDGSTLPPRTGPRASVFGRLAPNASMTDARNELNLIGAQLTAAHPDTHRHLKPRITSYAKPLEEGGQGRMLRNILYVVNSIFLMLLAIMCTNVATLVFARTAARSWEITVRSALGASRGRIVGQLFIEALVLASVAAVVGLLLANAALRWGLGMFAASAEGLPFWIDSSLSWRTMLYTALLTLFGAAIVGILPALRVTRANIQDALRSEAAGRAGLKFGGFWTAVIVVQVAINVLFLPLAAGGVFESNRFNQRAEGIGADNYIMSRVSTDREEYGLDSARLIARTRQSIEELERRLRAEPGIGQVAFADRVPVEDQFKYNIEVDSTSGVPRDLLRRSTLVHVSSGWFDAFGTSVVAGRNFHPFEFETGTGAARVMIVNESFARHVLGGRNAIGQRIRIRSGEIDRYASDDWYEIVGVVKDFGWQLPRPEEQSAMYRPSLPVVGEAGQLVVRARDPDAVAKRLRTIAAEVDPTIRLTSVQRLSKAGGGEAQSNWALTTLAWFVGFIVLLLSGSGIHALMSFTVARRTREIGIRAALGAGRGKIVAGIFSRALLQIGTGILVGSVIAAWAGLGSTRAILLLLAADAIMLVVGLAACALPVRRALRINPTDALRAEG